MKKIDGDAAKPKQKNLLKKTQTLDNNMSSKGKFSYNSTPTGNRTIFITLIIVHLFSKYCN